MKHGAKKLLFQAPKICSVVPQEIKRSRFFLKSVQKRSCNMLVFLKSVEFVFEHFYFDICITR